MGIPIIVVDPRKNDTFLQLEAEWIPLRPATDAAFVDAMAYVIWKKGLADKEFLDRCCLGFDREHMPEGIDPDECVLSYLTGITDGIPKTPEWAAEITGTNPEIIEDLAVRYASAGPAVLLQGYGSQRHAYGEQSGRGAILLACMTGNVGISGRHTSGIARCIRHNSPGFPISANPYGRSILVYCWTEAVERGYEMTAVDGVIRTDRSKNSQNTTAFDMTKSDNSDEIRLESDIKMIINLAGNCLINQHGDINRTSRLLQDTSKCEFIVCSNIFMTASAKFADILLPATSAFESENMTTPWHWGDFIGFNNKICEPVGECRFEYDWLPEIADRLGCKRKFTEDRSLSDWLKYIYEELRKKETELPEYEIFKKAGVYKYKNNPEIIAFADSRQDPETYPFPTESGKIELFSPSVYRTEYKDFFPAIPRYVEPPEGVHDSLKDKYPLQLIGWHTKASS